MKKLSLIWAVVVAIIAVSCVKELNQDLETNEPSVESALPSEVTFKAAFGAISKASLELGDKESKVAWDKDDKVSVLVDENNFLFTAKDAGYSTTLTTQESDVPEQGDYYAVYPYDQEASFADNYILTSLPSVQTAVLSSFSTHLAVAHAENNSFAFKNVCGLIGVMIDADNVTKIVFEGNDSEIVSGGISVAVSDTPAWEAVAEKGAKSVTLVPAEGNTTLEKGPYYFAVLPQTFSKGFKVTSYKGDDAYVVRNISASYTLQRADIVGGKPFGIDGDGTQENPYLLKTPQDMIDMRDLAKLGGETWFQMVNDIDMKGVNWVPLNYNQNFERKIHFDGGDFTLSNLTCDKAKSGADYPSLFGVLYGSCRNLKIDKATITSTSCCGVVGGYVGTGGKPGLVENVAVTNSSVTNQGERAGGVCGDAKQATFKNVSFQGTVTSTYESGAAYAGGFVGKTEISAIFEDCSVDVTVSAKNTCVGGFAGITEAATATYTRCNVKANVTSTKNIVGGFVGQSVNATYEDCEVTDVNVTATQDVAGFCGKIANGKATLNGCKVSGTISATSSSRRRAGGFVGYLDGTVVTIESCDVLEGTVIKDNSGSTTTAIGAMGGFVGWCGARANDGNKVLFDNCSSSITIDNPKGHSLGGFIGNVGQGLIEIKNTTAAGTVNGAENIGGFIGYQEKGTLDLSNVSTSVKVTSGHYSGGFIGRITGAASFTDCSSTKDMKGISSCSPFAGWLARTSSLNMTRCFATGAYEGGSNLGGLVGIVEDGAAGEFVMDGCYYKGAKISGAGTIGGLVGYLNGQWTINNSYVETEVACTSANIGGLIGSVVGGDAKDEKGNVIATTNTTLQMTNCYFSGKVVATNYAGGAIGRINGGCKSLVLSKVSTNGSVKGGQYVGGVIGASMGSTSQSISESWSSTSVTATGNKIGGLIGALTQPMAVTDCYASGQVSSESTGCGGLLGSINNVVELSGSYATGKVISTAGHAGGLIGETTATVTIDDCYATGAVSGAGYGVAGLVGYTGAICTITKSHAAGSVTSTSSHCAGLVGEANADIKISRCYTTGNVSGKGNRAAGLIAYPMYKCEIDNCYSTGSVSNTGQQNGGLVGFSPAYTTNKDTGAVTTDGKLYITNSFASGDVGTGNGSAGILGNSQGAEISVVGCVAWNKNVASSSRAAGNYAPAAIVGSSYKGGTFKNCYRRYDMVLTDKVNLSVLYDQADVENGLLPILTGASGNYNRAYQGKAAAAGATISSVAKQLGWDETIWDLSKDVPALK